MANPIIIQEGSLRNYQGWFREALRPAQLLNPLVLWGECATCHLPVLFSISL
jgi:hypothetical protein